MGGWWGLPVPISRFSGIPNFFKAPSSHCEAKDWGRGTVRMLLRDVCGAILNVGESRTAAERFQKADSNVSMSALVRAITKIRRSSWALPHLL